MRIVSFLSDPPVIRQILGHLNLPIRPPLLAPPRGPPQHDLLALDPPSPFDLPTSARAERDPFDQSLPGGERHLVRVDGLGAGRPSARSIKLAFGPSRRRSC